MVDGYFRDGLRHGEWRTFSWGCRREVQGGRARQKFARNMRLLCEETVRIQTWEMGELQSTRLDSALPW